jgi:hypothetical protein
MKSSFLKINLVDLLKSALTAGLTAVATVLYSVVQTGVFPATLTEWKKIGLVGALAAAGYLLKNLLSNGNGEFLSKDPK